MVSEFTRNILLMLAIALVCIGIAAEMLVLSNALSWTAFAMIVAAISLIIVISLAAFISIKRAKQNK